MKAPHAIKLRKTSKASVVVNLTFLVLAAFTVAGFFLMDTGGANLGKSFAGVWKAFTRCSLRPK